MLALFRYVLLTAKRDFLLLSLSLLILFAGALSVFLGNIALAEPESMVIANMAGSGRIIVNLGMIIFIATHIKRSFDSKEIELFLSMPISRSKFILSYFTAFSFIGVMLTLPVILLIFLIKFSFDQALLYWWCSLILELMITIAFTLLASLIVKSATASIIASMGFYTMARLSGFFIMMIPYPIEFHDIKDLAVLIRYIGEMGVKISTIFFPRFDLFTQSHWLIYGVKQINLVLWESLIYLPFLIVMAIIDFRKKQL